MNILSIQSEVVTGHVGNAAARFALQRLGHEAWCVPTVLLSSHAGHKGFAGEATSLELLQKLVDALDGQGRLAECDGLISGYLGSPDQAKIVAETVRRAKIANPRLIYCLDPAFGDDGRIYARPGIAEAMAEILLPLADIVTPNAFELSVLSGIDVANTAAAERAVRKLGRPLVVAKSVPAPGLLGALTIINDTAWLAATPVVEKPPRGAGDLFAALFFGHYLSGRLTAEVLDLATRGVYHVLVNSAGLPEMRLIAEQDALAAPPKPKNFRFGPLEGRAHARA
jgi:pyridoxine kinase